MGEVYMAEDTRLGRQVALKILPDRMAADGEWLVRFRREARAVARINHPNIVTLYDIDQVDGTHFFTMELVKGKTLGAWAEESAPTPADLHRLACDLAGALAVAHDAGIVHRDLKPSNIMVTADGRPKILDFGLARQEESVIPGSDNPTAVMTEPGTLIGTLRYMSPEQARGQPAGKASDIFSLGIVLFELATGRQPFAGDSKSEHLASLLRDRAPPVRRVNPAIPKPFAAVIDRCLERDPEARIPSATEMERLLRSEETPVTPARGDDRRSIAVLPFTDLSPERDQEYFCDGLAEELIGALGRIRALRVVARSSAFRFKGQPEQIGRIREALSVGSVLEGSVRKAGNRVRISIQLVDCADESQVWSERFDRQLEDIFEIQDEIARRVADTLQVQLVSGGVGALVQVEARDIEAYNLYLRGRHAWNQRTAEALEASLEFFRKALEAEPDYARAHAGAADAYALLGIYGPREPSQVMPLAKASALRALEIEPGLADAHTSAGYVRSIYEWDWEEGESSFRRAIALEPGYATAHHWYAISNLLPRGRFEQAETELAEAIRLDPLSPILHVTMGLATYFGHQFERARRRLEQALELDRNFAFGRLFLGRTLSELGEHAAAISELRRAIELSGGSAEMEAALGYAHARAGDAEKAEERLRRLAELAQSSWVAPSLAAQIHAGLDRRGEALDGIARGLAFRASDLAWLRHWPVFARLRGEPRFAELCDRIGV